MMRHHGDLYYQAYSSCSWGHQAGGTGPNLYIAIKHGNSFDISTDTPLTYPDPVPTQTQLPLVTSNY